MELRAPVHEVWDLVGDLSRFPEYSSGLARVETIEDDEGRCVEYTCHFEPVEEGAEATFSRDAMRWYEPGRGYLSVELGGTWDGSGSTVARLTLDPIEPGTLLTYDIHWDADDVETTKAHFDEALADIAANLVARFGGTVAERYVEP
jgi:hypothetical protein